MLIANKTDLAAKRLVTSQQCKELAEELKLQDGHGNLLHSSSIAPLMQSRRVECAATVCGHVRSVKVKRGATSF
jgi:hypothetical protein